MGPNVTHSTRKATDLRGMSLNMLSILLQKIAQKHMPRNIIMLINVLESCIANILIDMRNISANMDNLDISDPMCASCYNESQSQSCDELLAICPTYLPH
eukprot:11918105-Ditylum_brightwellii.AAC.1